MYGSATRLGSALVRPFVKRTLKRVVARRCATVATGADTAPPTNKQLQRLCLAVGIPMVGFGFADNFIMIIAGDLLGISIVVPILESTTKRTLSQKLTAPFCCSDQQLSYAYGFSTLAAAGLGNLISDVCGISLGEVIEAGAERMGAPQAHGPRSVWPC